MTRAEREALRRRFDFACAYCGVSETDYGARLTTDHFQPVAREGRDEASNWVYACFACNGFKSDYWSQNPEEVPLHPERDNSSQHLQWESNGELTALTTRGELHLRLLHLNRPELVARRRRDAELAEERRLTVELLEEIGGTEENVANLLNRLRNR